MHTKKNHEDVRVDCFLFTAELLHNSAERRNADIRLFRSLSPTGTLRDAWRTTPIKWYPIPVLLGACVLVGIQARRLYLTEQNQRREGADGKVIDGNAKSVRLDGPWTVSLYLLPLIT